MAGRPVLAVDIDGVLNALGEGPPPEGWGDILVCRSEGSEPPRLFRLRFRPDHGRRLREIADETGAELVWCSRWQQQANDLMAPLLSLPPLPWVPMQGSKADALRAWAGDRPFCWLDDEPETAHLHGCRVPHKVITTGPRTGLTDADLEAAREWLSSLTAGAVA